MSDGRGLRFVMISVSEPLNESGPSGNPVLPLRLPFIIRESVFLKFIRPFDITWLASKLALDPLDWASEDSLLARSGNFSRYSSVGSIFQIRTVWSAEQVARFLTSGDRSSRVR